MMKKFGLFVLFTTWACWLWGQSTRDTLGKVLQTWQATASQQQRKLQYRIYAGPASTEVLDSVELEIIRSEAGMYVRIGTLSENFYNERESLLIDHENRVMWLEGHRPYPDGLPVPTLGRWLAGLDSLIHHGHYRLSSSPGQLKLTAGDALPMGDLVLHYDPERWMLRRLIYYAKEATPLLNLTVKEPLRIELELISQSNRAVLPDRSKYLDRRQPTPPYAHYQFTNLLR